MGIRRKISLGFVIIGVILFISSVISVFEFSRMRHSVTSLMKDNINSINTSRLLLELTDEYNFELLSRVIKDSTASSADIIFDDRFDNYIGTIKKSFTSEEEVAVADSLSNAYSDYIAVINKTPDIMVQNVAARIDWYQKELRPVYYNLKKYKKQLGLLTQAALANNTRELQEGYYRSIMPGIIAVGAGVLLVILFNYFLNLYFISPIILISRGIKNFREYRKSYNVQFDNDDELQDLNTEVKSIIDENKNLKKAKQQHEL